MYRVTSLLAGSRRARRCRRCRTLASVTCRRRRKCRSLHRLHRSRFQPRLSGEALCEKTLHVIRASKRRTVRASKHQSERENTNASEHQSVRGNTNQCEQTPISACEQTPTRVSNTNQCPWASPRGVRGGHGLPDFFLVHNLAQGRRKVDGRR